MVYKWKTGFYKTDAEVAGKVFEELDKTVGLTAKTLVDASRDESAPLHDEFEWDDAVAGEKWREQTARVMICNLTITVEESTEATPIRAYVKIEDNADNYESIRTVLKSEEKTDSLMTMAMKELSWFQTKYASLKELTGVFKEIDKLKNREDGRKYA